MTSPERQIAATRLLDQLDAAEAELAYWLDTGEYVACPRCTLNVPAAGPGVPTRHQVGGLWCEEDR